jgi:hypothetical protein
MKAKAHGEDSYAGQTRGRISSRAVHGFALILHQLDVAAIVVSSLGLGLLVLTTVVLGLIDAVKFLASYWSNSLDRSLVLIAGCAVFWVVVRWKKTRTN